jgi:uncharacterized YccA/Bax inhibitor family protein
MMSGSPVLNDRRFDDVTADDRAGWGAPTQSAPGHAGPIAPTGTMTVGGTVLALGVLLVLLLGAGAFGWMQSAPEPIGTQIDPATGNLTTVYSTTWPGWLWIAMIVGIGAALVTAFKPKMARFLSPIYALAYGAVLGAISHLYEQAYEGIVLQAIGATLGVVAVMFVLYATGIIKVTKRYVMVVVAATLGIFAFYMLAFVASFFGADLYFMNEPSALGIAVSAGIALVAALNLAIDFAFIDHAAKSDYPKYMEWYGAFGVTVTIVWLYLEILRLLSLLRQ